MILDDKSFALGFFFGILLYFYFVEFFPDLIKKIKNKNKGGN